MTSVEPKLAKNVSNTQKIFQHVLTSHNENMDFKELNFDEFEEVFKSLKRTKTADFDDLNSSIIIDAYDNLKNILFRVFKVSIKQ